MKRALLYTMVLCLAAVLLWGCGQSGGGVAPTTPTSSAGDISYAGDPAIMDEAPIDEPDITKDNKRKIVVYKESLADDAKVNICGQYGQFVKNLNIVNASVVIVADDVQLQALKDNPAVLRVDDDAVFQAVGKPQPAPTVVPAQTIPWGISRMKANQAWTYSRGTNVKVAVIDTGISLTHPDLKVYGGVNTITSTKTANDDNGHGTHCAGIIAALNNTAGVVGIGPEIQLYAVKVLNSRGSGWVSDIIEGIQWAVANNMQVANMSLGGTSDNQSYHDAIIAAYNAGLTIVAAAGNESTGVIYPAKYPETLAVSASDQSDKLATFSNYGPEVDFIAPGVSIYSTYKGTSYYTASGTSMATPHVTACVALKIALSGPLSPAQVKAALTASAVPLMNLTTDQQGAGMIDCYTLVTTP